MGIKSYKQRIYCSDCGRITVHKVDDYTGIGYNSVGQQCQTCGLYKEVSKKSKKVISKERLHLRCIKDYRGEKVDCELNNNILNKLNANPNISIKGVCAGHSRPTEPKQMFFGNVPDVSFCFNQQPKKLPKIPNTKITKISDKCYTLRGTKKGNKKWWNNVSNTLYRL